jgi:hypothetical protein
LGKLLDEVHENRVSGSFRYRELLQESKGFVPQNFGSSACSAGFAIIPNESLKIGPGISATDDIEGFVLAEMSCSRVIMTVSGDPKA